MGIPVILAEKPNQAKAYAAAFQIEKREKTHIQLKSCSTFPDGAVITWGIGHLVSLKMPGEYREEWKSWDLKNLPILPSNYEFKVSESKKAQYNAVKKLFNQADLLVNACDIDREGSNIFYSIYHMTGVKNKEIKRLWINSLEVDEIRKGFQNLQSNEKDLLMYQEAQTRQISDWLVGMNGSQLYTLLLRNQGLETTLSIGRVQSPTVYMIYQRQKEIEKFVSKPFFELIGNFATGSGDCYVGKAGVKVDTQMKLNSFLVENDLTLDKRLCGIIKAVEKKQKHSKSPKLHSLSTLQVIANKKWKYSPAKVLEVAQSLYEKKLMTYPRSDCNYITESEFAYLVGSIKDYQALLGITFEANTQPDKRYVDGSRVQEHYSIIPTKKSASESVFQSLSSEEKNIYLEVIRNTVAMFHNDYVYEETKIKTLVNNVEFETIGKTELDKGWKLLFSNEGTPASDSDESTLSEASTILPSVEKDEKVLSVLNNKEGRTVPPKPYSEGQLITMMKTAGKSLENGEESDILKEIEGIGTEATRAGIIETIKKHEYIEVKKNIVSVTGKGIVLCEVLECTCPLLSTPGMTAKWETYLRKIGEGSGTQESFLRNVTKFIENLIETAPKNLESEKIQVMVKEEQEKHTLGVCPVCKNGKMLDKKTFIGCSEYQNGCTFSISKTIAKKKLTEKQIRQLIEVGKTDLIKKFTSSKTGKTFDAHLIIKENKVDFEYAKKK